jgi:hypothetical protein
MAVTHQFDQIGLAEVQLFSHPLKKLVILPGRGALQAD